MRVPVYESKVRTQAIDAPKVGVAPTGLDELAKGISHVGAVASNIGEDLYKEKVKAKNTRIDGALDEYERERTRIGFNDDENKGERGIFNVNGAAAFETGRDRKAVDTLAEWAKKRAEVETDPDVRSELTMRFREKNTYFERDVEKHTASQREVAEKVAFDSFVGSTLRGITAVNGPDQIASDLAALEARAGTISNSSQEAIDRGNKVKAAYLGRLLDVRLETGDIDAAEQIIKENKNNLDPRDVDAATRKIRKVRFSDEVDEGVEVTIAKSEYVSPSGGTFAPKKNPGWVDENLSEEKFQQFLDSKNYSPEEKVAARAVFEDSMRRAADIRKADIKRNFQQSETAYTKSYRAFLDADSTPWLREHAPDLWRRLNDDAMRKWRMARADERAERPRAGTNDDKLALQKYLASGLTEGRQAMEEADIGMLIAGLNVTEEGRQRILARNKADKERFQKGESSSETDYVTKAVRRADPSAKGGEKEEKLRAFAAERYDNLRRELGHVPSDDEVEEDISKAVVGMTEQDRSFLGIPYKSSVPKWQAPPRVVPDEPAKREAAPLPPKPTGTVGSRAVRIEELKKVYGPGEPDRANKIRAALKAEGL
jgi:hypothetical protein